MNQLPTFLQETFDADEKSAGGAFSTEQGPVGAVARQATDAMETLAALSGLVAPATDIDAIWHRLSKETSSGALRYGPFLDELQELFDLQEPTLRAQLDAALSSNSKWSRTPFAGVRLFRLAPGPRVGASEAYLASLAPGAHVPPHRHPGEEVTLVLEGGYADDEGNEHHAGSLVHAPASDAFHSLRVIGAEGCMIALRLEKRFVFASPFYRFILGAFWK